MSHPDWCGKPCYSCNTGCSLDTGIPCSPDCEGLSHETGLPNSEKCKTCDVARPIIESRLKAADDEVIDLPIEEDGYWHDLFKHISIDHHQDNIRPAQEDSQASIPVEGIVKDCIEKVAVSLGMSKETADADIVFYTTSFITSFLEDKRVGNTDNIGYIKSYGIQDNASPDGDA